MSRARVQIPPSAPKAKPCVLDGHRVFVILGNSAFSVFVYIGLGLFASNVKIVVKTANKAERQFGSRQHSPRCIVQRFHFTDSIFFGFVSGIHFYFLKALIAS